jgi:NADPH oxidase 1
LVLSLDEKSLTDFRIVPNVDSFEWFQALLSNLEQEVIYTPYDAQHESLRGGPSQFLRVHNYLTAKLDESTVQNIMINDAGAINDPLTGLQSRTHYGRPNWKAMFTRMRDGIEGGTYIHGLTGMRCKVGVYVCGPAALAKTLKKQCKETSSEFVNCKHLNSAPN